MKEPETKRRIQKEVMIFYLSAFISLVFCIMTDFLTKFGKYRNVKCRTPSGSTKYVIFKRPSCGGRVLRAHFITSIKRMA